MPAHFCRSRCFSAFHVSILARQHEQFLSISSLDPQKKPEQLEGCLPARLANLCLAAAVLAPCSSHTAMACFPNPTRRGRGTNEDRPNGILPWYWRYAGLAVLWRRRKKNDR
jgi:hypothetical protein